MNRPTTGLLLLVSLLLAIGLSAFLSRHKSSAEPAQRPMGSELSAKRDISETSTRKPALPAPLLRMQAEKEAGEATHQELPAPILPMQADSDAPAPLSPHQSFRSSIRDQIAATETDISTCFLELEDPSKVNGTALLTFIMARGEDSEIVIEDTGIDFDETTIENEGLVQCMSRSAKKMIFTSIPEGVDAVSVTRRLVVSEGAVSEHKLTEYANLRDSE